MKKKAYLVPHTHWDREWYMTFQQYRYHLVKLVDELLAAFEQGKAKVFVLDGQTVVVEDYLEIKPENEGRLKEAVVRGRLYVGPWYVLPDMNLVSGEAVVRNLLVGARIAKKLGHVMKAGYVPDPFGHFSQLPQILAGFGLNTFIFTRGLGEKVEDLGTEFWWKAPDGSRVLAIFLRYGYSNGANIGSVSGWRRHYDGKYRYDFEEGKKRLREIVGKALEHSNLDLALVCNGSDHQPIQFEAGKLLEAVAEEMGIDAEVTSYEQFSEDALLRAERANLKEIEGELLGARYYHMLYGVWSARTYLKRRNAEVEVLLEKVAEPLAFMATLLDPSYRYPAEFIRYAWKTLLRNQPHDSICGCSVDQVHREMLTRYDEAQQVGEMVALEAARKIAERVNTAGEGKPLVVFNTLQWDREEVLEFGVAVPAEWREVKVVDAEGREVEAAVVWEKETSGIVLHVPRKDRDLPGMVDITNQVLVRNPEMFEKQLTENGAPLPETLGKAKVLKLHALVRVPGVGYTTVRVLEGKPKVPEGGVIADAKRRVLENEYLRVEIKENGAIKLVDRETGEAFDNLLIFRDMADIGDEYDWGRAGDTPITTESSKPEIVVEKVSPLVAQARITHRIELPESYDWGRKTRSKKLVENLIEVTLRLKRKSKVLEVDVVCDNKSKDHRLQILFPTGKDTDKIFSEMHFAVVERKAEPPDCEGWVQKPVCTYPQKSFSGVDIGNGRAFAVLNLGLPEVELLKDEGLVLAVTLLRAVGWVSRGDIADRKGHAGPSIIVEDAQCIGKNEFRLGIYVGEKEGIFRWAYGVQVEPLIVPVEAKEGDLPPEGKVLEVGGRVVVSALKMGEWEPVHIVRVFEPWGKGVEATVRFPGRKVKSMSLVNLGEDRMTGEGVEEGGRFDVKPFRIATLRVVI